MDTPTRTLAPGADTAVRAQLVRQFRLALLWPLRLMPPAMLTAFSTVRSGT